MCFEFQQCYDLDFLISPASAAKEILQQKVAWPNIIRVDTFRMTPKKCNGHTLNLLDRNIFHHNFDFVALKKWAYNKNVCCTDIPLINMSRLRTKMAKL